MNTLTFLLINTSISLSYFLNKMKTSVVNVTKKTLLTMKNTTKRIVNDQHLVKKLYGINLNQINFTH